MLTLAEAVAQYGTRTAFPQVGDTVLFERADDGGRASVNVGEVILCQPAETWRKASVTVRGIWTFYPDGTSRRFRGRTPYAFPANHFLTPLEERLEAVAKHFEARAMEVRAWAAKIKSDA